MASIVSGFEYDIFISYRHNDNLDGWVTDFVQNLEKELRGTLKDSLTIYFDKSPHDGLLETHNVDKSLEGKLKCLIFIPVISQTYCDPKSFAWQHEFCAFNKRAKESLMGRDIRLGNGNVASRILAIKIHELDPNDKQTIENEIGGVLRAIDFIYKEPGVNRALKPSDSKNESQNKTDYRNQLNKVANAVKEIITSLKNPVIRESGTTATEQPTSLRPTGKKRIYATALGALLLITVLGYLLYPALNSSNKAALLDKSVAVLPFVDLSEAKDQGWFSDGLTEEILNSLAHVKGLSVISRTSSFAFKDKNLRIQTIADSLNVNYVVEGSVRKSDTGFRITAQLIRANDGFHVWSSTYDRSSRDIFVLQQDIASNIAASLDISLDPEAVDKMQWAGTNNPDAYLAFLKGQKLSAEGHVRRDELLPYLKRANLLFDDAIRLDPDFIIPYLYSGDFYIHFLTRNEKQNLVFKDTMTDAQAYRLMRKGIENAVEKSGSDISKDYYRLFLIMNSNDWSGLRATLERVLKSPDAVQLFSYQPYDISALATCLGYGQQVSALSRTLLRRDPLNRSRQRDIVSTSLFAGDYAGAIESIDSMNTLNEDPFLNGMKISTLFSLKKFDEANVLLTNIDSGLVIAYHSRLAILTAQRGDLKAAREIMDRGKQADYDLEGIEAAYGRDEANREASRLDKSLIMHHGLLYTYLQSPKNLPFDISAAPNFARRFRQAGVIIE